MSSIYARRAQLYLVWPKIRKCYCKSARARTKSCNFGGFFMPMTFCYVFDRFPGNQSLFDTPWRSVAPCFAQNSQLPSAPPSSYMSSSVNSTRICSSIERQTKCGLNRVSGALFLIFARVKTLRVIGIYRTLRIDKQLSSQRCTASNAIAFDFIFCATNKKMQRKREFLRGIRWTRNLVLFLCSVFLCFMLSL